MQRLYSSLVLILCGLFPSVVSQAACAADWPTWRGNSARGGFTAESLPAELALHWRLQLPVPSPAWPAEQGKVRFDASYEPVAARGLLFVPSMVEDSVAAYRLADGALIWRLFTDGPVRFAPASHGHRLLFVSDDGYLYCVDADTGALVWKLRGGPRDRKILGNDRLISMWPARGAPVVYGDTVYFAAGLWPFLGVFVHAVEIDTGRVVWTNSGTGSEYTVQQHNSPAFAGIAPQGYLAVNEQFLFVSGGMTVPAVFDRRTGQLQYYRPGDRQLGKDQGGYEVVLGPDWFVNHGGLFRSSDGESLAKTDVDIVVPDGAYGIAGKQLVASHTQLAQIVEETVDKQGKTKRTVKFELPVSRRWPVPDGVTTLHLKAADRFVASDGGSRLMLLSTPESDGETCRVDWAMVCDAPVSRALVAAQRLIVVDEGGAISCFGSRETAPVAPLAIADVPTPIARRTFESAQDVLPWLAHTAARAGYAVIDQPGSIEPLVALAAETNFHIIAWEADAARCDTLRAGLQRHGLLGTRVAVLPGNVVTADLPPYMADVLVAHEGLAQTAADPERLAAVLNVLRPYGGVAIARCHEGEMPDVVAACTQRLPEYETEVAVDWLVVRRPGPLPGAGQWTSQNGDAGNTLVSAETRVELPLGLLWFGGPSNRDVLPRHGHGPVPQVLGGRLFIQGRDMLRAVDVYTGRLLWQREFPDVGIFYDNTGHHAGAGAIGGNYVSTPDSLYLVWGRRCLRLDPATGETVAEFSLPPDETGQAPFWGYIGVKDDVLIAGSAPMLLLTPAPGEVIDKEDKDQERRNVPLFSQFGEGSRRLVVMDRFTGEVHWSREAQFNFRHNAMAVGDGKVFCMDRMTEQRLAHFRRRGQVPVADFSLLALDMRTGDVVWEDSEHAFGTWLAYSEAAGLLLQGGSKNRDRAADEVGSGLAVIDGATGRLVWRVDDDYGGPPLLYSDAVVTQGTAYDLGTGARRTRQHPLTGEEIPWKFARNYGCDTAIGCTNLLTFRSAAAGYYDLAHDAGTGNWGGFRSSCTANLIPADGVLNAPDYTRTCTCSYQNQCSLALVSMPDAEMWTFNPIPSSGRRVVRLGINFGAPGDRRAEDGTLWLDFPSVGGPSPDVPLTISGEPLDYVRQHASTVPGVPLPWVFASGVRGARHVRIRLASAEAAGDTLSSYTVRMYWRAAADAGAGAESIAVRLQGEVTPSGQRTVPATGSDPSAAGVIQQWRQVAAGEFLDIDISAAGHTETGAEPPILCGVEVLLDKS